MAGWEPQRRRGERLKGNCSVGLEGELLVVTGIMGHTNWVVEPSWRLARVSLVLAPPRLVCLGVTTIEPNGQTKQEGDG